MGLFRKHDQLEQLDAEHEARAKAHLKRVEESLLLVDSRYRTFTKWGSGILGVLTVLRVLSYAALGICIANDSLDHRFALWVVTPAFVVSHLGSLIASPIYEDRRRQWLNRYWCDQVEKNIAQNKEPNQALQTTSGTRSGFGKTSDSDRQRRGV